MLEKWQIHSTEADKDDVVPTRYHKMCKYIMVLTSFCYLFARCDVVNIFSSYLAIYKNYKITSAIKNRADTIRVLSKNQISHSMVILDSSLFHNHLQLQLSSSTFFSKSVGYMG